MKKTAIILALALQFGFTNNASAVFEQGYMSPQDIVSALYLKYGKVLLDNGAIGCQLVTDDNRKSLGDSNPMTGEVSVSTPSSSFLTWIDSCLMHYHMAIHVLPSLTDSTEQIKRKNAVLAELYAPFMKRMEEIKRQIPDADIRVALAKIRYQDLSDQEREAFVANLLYWSLGSDEEILSYGLISDINGFRSDLLRYANGLNQSSLGEVTRALTKILLKRDEFLLY